MAEGPNPGQALAQSENRPWCRAAERIGGAGQIRKVGPSSMDCVRSRGLGERPQDFTCSEVCSGSS